MNINQLRQIVASGGACEPAWAYLYDFNGESDVKVAFDNLSYSNKTWLLHVIYGCMEIMGVTHEDIIKDDGFYRLTDAALDGFSRGMLTLDREMYDPRNPGWTLEFTKERNRRWNDFKAMWWELHGSQVLYLLESAVELL